MKRIIIFFTTLVLFSNLALGQIEEFNSSMLTNQQKTTKQVVKKTLCNVDYPATLDNNTNCEHPNLIGHQVYCTKTSISTAYTKKLLPLMMVSMNSEENTLTIVKYFKERYYNITDVLYLKDEIIDLKTKMENCQNFISDTIYYYHPNSKTRRNLTKNDVFALINFDKILENELNIYVLEDTIGNKYYVPDISSVLLFKKWSLQGGGGEKPFCAGRSVESSDFISVSTYNYVKDTFEGKDVIDLNQFVHNELRWIEDTSYYIKDKYATIDKVAVKDGTIVIVYTKKDGNKHVYDYWKTSKQTIAGRYIDKTDVYTLDYKEYETSGFLKKSGEFMLLSDAQIIFQKERDGLLAKKQREELQRQERENRARAEQQKQEQEKLERKQEKLEQEQARRAELIKKYGEKDGSLIADGKIFIGMTKEQLLDSKDEPCDKKVTTNTLGTYEIWTYNCLAVSLGWGKYYYVHLSNNKVVRIDE